MPYNYTKFKSSKISVETIDKLIDLAIVAPTSKFGAIFKMAQLLTVGVAIWARKNLIEEEILIERQEYQQRRSESNQSEVDQKLSSL